MIIEVGGIIDNHYASQTRQGIQHGTFPTVIKPFQQGLTLMKQDLVSPLLEYVLQIIIVIFIVVIDSLLFFFSSTYSQSILNVLRLLMKTSKFLSS